MLCKSSTKNATTKSDKVETKDANNNPNKMMSDFKITNKKFYQKLIFEEFDVRSDNFRDANNTDYIWNSNNEHLIESTVSK